MKFQVGLGATPLGTGREKGELDFRWVFSSACCLPTRRGLLSGKASNWSLGFLHSCLGRNQSSVHTNLEQVNAVSLTEKKWASQHGCPAAPWFNQVWWSKQKSLSGKVFTVSVSQDTGFEVVVSLISSFYLVNVKKCAKVGAAHASHQSHMGRVSQSTSSCLPSLF